MSKNDQKMIQDVKKKKLENLLKLILVQAKTENNWLVYWKSCLVLCVFYGFRKYMSFILNKQYLMMKTY